MITDVPTQIKDLAHQVIHLASIFAAMLAAQQTGSRDPTHIQNQPLSIAPAMREEQSLLGLQPLLTSPDKYAVLSVLRQYLLNLRFLHNQGYRHNNIRAQSVLFQFTDPYLVKLCTFSVVESLPVRSHAPARPFNWIRTSPMPTSAP